MSCMKKIYAMHARFGVVSDRKCGDCPHYLCYRYHNRNLLKCRAYGLTHSEATDWRKSYVACGLIDLPLPEDGTVFDRIKGQREYVREECGGQIRMEIE